MQKFIILMGASLALAACSSGGEDAATTTDTEAAAAPEAVEPATQLASMPTEALSGEAATAAMKERHDWFEEMGDAFKILNRQSKADAPDMAAVKEQTAIVAAKSAELPSKFAPGTGPDAGKTEAKANIWENMGDFMAKAQDFHTAATKLNTVAMADDAAGFKAAFGETGGTCKACHDEYREEE
jgi:cytochrome c556